MQIKPDLIAVKDSTVGFFKSLGPVFSIALIAFILIVGWYIFGWASDGFNKSKVDAEIKVQTDKAAASEAKAQQALTERDQAIGAAAVYKQQSEALENERTELLNARPELQKKVIESGKAVEAARNRTTRPIDEFIDQRIKDVGAKLDTLYPDQ